MVPALETLICSQRCQQVKMPLLVPGLWQEEETHACTDSLKGMNNLPTCICGFYFNDAIIYFVI